MDAEPPAEVRLAPSETKGVLGAWMLAGPFKGKLEERDPKPSRWIVANAAAGDPGAEGSRYFDLKSTLDARGSDLVAYASGRLHLEKAAKLLLLLGVDDGVRVSVDGTVVYTRDAARPLRDDDDIVPLDLAAGEHDILLKFHQRDGAWAFRARIVDRSLVPPTGTWLTLPGTNANDARSLAQKMSWLVVDRAFDPAANRYRPTLAVRFPEGTPKDVPLPVTAKLAGQFELDAGEAALETTIALPPLDPWNGTITLETSIAGRVVTSKLIARPLAEQALVRATKALANAKDGRPGSLDSVRFLVRRLERLVARGDGDTEAQEAEAKELDKLAQNLERGLDAYAGQSGFMRRAILGSYDGAPTEFGLYVPPNLGTKKLPLVVGLHGMNGYPLSMLRAMFGLDEEKKDSAWKDRHLPPAPPFDAIVVAPTAHWNTMYREVGEDDVLEVIAWAKRTFAIDETRITVTGPSMGGIGSASLPFHYPGVFAAAEPLCGYHSYLIRADLQRPKRPWERLLLEERSNVLWAENGEHLPLYIVHGTRDQPEANSGVLIERYDKLGYSVKHEHPDAGHNVWGVTYADFKGMKWLVQHKLDPKPSHVRFKTMRARYATSSWVTVDQLSRELSWGEVDATRTKDSVTITTSGVMGLSLDMTGPSKVTIDGTTLSFGDEMISLHREGNAWVKGRIASTGKHGRVTGPFRDIFHEPILFVWADGPEARANERIARFFANPSGYSVSYPVISDTEFFARREELANDRALFLVGRSNRVLAELGSFPIRVEDGAVTMGKERMTGREVGAAFIHPNPLRPDRYVVAVAGADVEGTLRAMSLPDLLPDFVVWDAGVAGGRGQILLGAAAFRAGGFFENDWSLPAITADPLAKTARVAPQNEREASPYLP